MDSFNSLQVGYKPDIIVSADCTVDDGFNSLQVGYKLVGREPRYFRFFQFQFLIGWLQTRTQKNTVLVLCAVSIPYRLATNAYLRPILSVSTQFQFLIGWLQTKRTYHIIVLNENKFQFLIGWLQTKILIVNKYPLIKSFNSLQVGYKPWAHINKFD